MPASDIGESGRPNGSMNTELALGRQAALEHVDRLGELIALDDRVLEHDDGVFGGLVTDFYERDHGVRRVVGDVAR
jgi:hypothetical protein